MGDRSRAPAALPGVLFSASCLVWEAGAVHRNPPRSVLPDGAHNWGGGQVPAKSYPDLRVPVGRPGRPIRSGGWFHPCLGPRPPYFSSNLSGAGGQRGSPPSLKATTALNDGSVRHRWRLSLCETPRIAGLLLFPRCPQDAPGNGLPVPRWSLGLCWALRPQRGGAGKVGRGVLLRAGRPCWPALVRGSRTRPPARRAPRPPTERRRTCPRSRGKRAPCTGGPSAASGKTSSHA